MKFLYPLFIILATINAILAASTPDISTTSAPQPVYKPSDNYIPHATYPYAETYPVPGYDGFLVPAIQPYNYNENDDTSLSNVPVSYLHY